MMSKNRLTIVPVSSPTSHGESQEKTSTTTGAVNPATTPGGGKQTTIHVTALDGIVNVNSLFTMSLFIGLSMTDPEKATTMTSAACTTVPNTVRRLIVLEVVAFSFFLFSSLVAQSLKLLINLKNNMDPTDADTAKVNVDHLKYCLLASAVGSVLGCTFLMMSIVDFIRVKLGSLSCGGNPVYAVVALLVFVGGGLVIYVATAFFAVFFVRGESGKIEERG